MELAALLCLSIVSCVASYAIGYLEGRRAEWLRIIAWFRKSPTDLFEELKYESELPPIKRAIRAED